MELKMPNILVEAMVGVTQAMAVVAILAVVVATLVVVVAIQVAVVVTLVVVAAIQAVEEGIVAMAVAVAGHTTEVAEGAAITLAKLLLHKLRIRLTIETMQFYVMLKMFHE